MRAGFALVLILLVSFGIAINDVMAKRFGGGRSFGVQRSKSSLFNHQSHYAKKASSGQQTKFNKWRGFLGGALLGGLLASLLMGHGLGSALLSWLFVGSLILLIIGFLSRKKRFGFQNQPAGFNQAFQPEVNSGSGSYHSGNYPADFEIESFLRSAKVAFMRLQTAYDQANLSEITEFTAPEVTAEITMQLHERDNSNTHSTEIVSLNAVLLDISKQANSFMASVHFTGSTKENDQLSKLDEIWHFRKFAHADKWLVAGIQQEIYEPQ